MTAFEFLYRLIVHLDVVAVLLFVFKHQIAFVTVQRQENFHVFVCLLVFGQQLLGHKFGIAFRALEAPVAIRKLAHVTLQRRFAAELLLALVALKILLRSAVMLLHVLSVRIARQQLLLAEFAGEFDDGIGIVLDQFVTLQAVPLTESVSALVAREWLLTAEKRLVKRWPFSTLYGGGERVN